MVKYLKTAFFIILYTFIYLFFMLLCQIVLGLTIGGAGRGLVEFLTPGAPVDQAHVNDAANIASRRINEYVTQNTGLIFSISALLSLLVYIKIFSARKLNLFSLLHMDRRPFGADIRYGAFAGASANFVISLIVVLLQSFGLFTEAFSRHEAHMEATFGTGGVLATLLGVGIIIPLIEEIMFRGMIVYELGRSAPWKAVIIIQGVIFGIYHLVPVQIFYTIPLGIYFGYIVYKTGSIWPAAAGHIAMNSVSILLVSSNIMETSDASAFSFIYMILSAYMFISALIYFIKKKPSAAGEGG